LLTCETGRERKSRFEGLDILNHYYRAQKQAAQNDNPSSAKQLSLEEEIRQLQEKGKNEAESVFSHYETGVKGTIALICNLPDAVFVPPWCKEIKKSNDNEDECQQQGQAKKRRLDETDSKTLAAVTLSPSWDPVETVRTVLSDLRSGSAMAPSSRFVIRMIPLQATCFANDEELVHTVTHLYARCDQEASTFAVQVKRRICEHWKSKDVIELVAKHAPPKWKVNLSEPKYTIIVEICKTLCGISIVEKSKNFGKFNLVEVREKADSQKTEKSISE
jgi:tRNA acetyltransferase TAN1